MPCAAPVTTTTSPVCKALSPMMPLLGRRYHGLDDCRRNILFLNALFLLALFFRLCSVGDVVGWQIHLLIDRRPEHGNAKVMSHPHRDAGDAVLTACRHVPVFLQITVDHVALGFAAMNSLADR